MEAPTYVSLGLRYCITPQEVNRSTEGFLTGGISSRKRLVSQGVRQ